MAVFTTADQKELIVTCNCGCQESFHLAVDKEDGGYYCLLMFMKGNFYTEQKISPWRAFLIKCRKLWCVLTNKDYCYSDTIMSKSEFEIFKNYINQFD